MPNLANSTSLVKIEATPASVLAQVCAAAGAGLAASVRKEHCVATRDVPALPQMEQCAEVGGGRSQLG
jgi:hypothetical protein